ncbi:MAG TPA: hypothetical protein VIM38_11560 [Alphaproteobacteria bacterium]
MDYRILIAAAVGLVLVAFGGFYLALSSRLHEPAAPPVRSAAAPSPSAPDRTAQSQAAKRDTAQPGATPAGKATAASIEAEIAQSEHAELQALLKTHFAKEYNELIEVAVRRRNEGASDEAFGQELFTRFQEIMRPRLRFAVAASMPMIDKLAANEVGLFHALGTEGAAFCLKVLGKDTAAASPLPDGVRRLMRLGTLYRFQAIVDGMQRYLPVDPLAAPEIAAFEASLAREGMKFEDVRTGAFMNKGGEEPGKPCLMVEKLYQAIARLEEGPRRKVYAGVFFLGRDK